MTKRSYKITGIIFFIAGAAYTARAFSLLRTPGELPATNSYLLVIGILSCLSAAGIYICGTDKVCEKPNFSYDKMGSFAALVCFVIFTLMFEKIGTIKASFILSLILGTIWNRAPISKAKNTSQKFNFMTYLGANKWKIAENILAACACAWGIWLVFERVFSLSLP
ncbi:MAG: tripartite tricarboxylate transporter TctB family protein [Synergistaceae bacterium]|nr:tripartite tricarboxylate transporter TctB family protein [Synergistaceae bacterium]